MEIDVPSETLWGTSGEPTSLSWTRCLCHSPRSNPGEFDELCRGLRGAVVPKTYIKRLGYLLCTCKKKHTTLDDEYAHIGLSAIQKAVSGYISAADEKSECDTSVDGKEPIRPKSHELLASLLRNNTEISTNLSWRRLVLIIYLCLTKSYALLQPRKHHQEELEAYRNSTRVEKVFYRHRKHHKQETKFSEILPLPEECRSNMERFVGKRGIHLRGFSDDYPGSRVTINKAGESDGGGSHDDERLTTVTISAMDEKELQAIKVKMMQNIQRVVKEHRERQERKLKLRKARDYRSRTGWLDTNKQESDFWFMGLDKKEADRDVYATKCLHAEDRVVIKPSSASTTGDDIEQTPHRSSSKMKRESPAKMHKSHPLEEGSRCLYCLTPYVKDIQYNGACRFHPGYIGKLDQRWTCCQAQATSDRQPGQADSHRDTGCATGLHNWRPHKKASDRKAKSKSHTQ